MRELMVVSVGFYGALFSGTSTVLHPPISTTTMSNVDITVLELILCGYNVQGATGGQGHQGQQLHRGACHQHIAKHQLCERSTQNPTLWYSVTSAHNTV